MNKTKVVIVVNGGNVDAVFSNNPTNVEAILVDWDNIKESGELKDENDENSFYYTEGAGEIDVDPLFKAPDEVKALLIENDVSNLLNKTK